MRRNLRLKLVLLLLALLYIATLLYNSTSTQTTLQNISHSASSLTDHFSVFVPTRYRSITDIRAANAKIQVRGKFHPKHRRKSNIPIRSKVKIAYRQRKQRYAKSVKRAKEGNPKTLDKRIKLSRSAVQSNPNGGSGQGLQDISKTKIEKNSQSISALARVITSPNHQKPRTKSKYHDSASDGSLSDVQKTTVLPTQVQKQAMTLQSGNKESRSASTSGVRVIIAAHGRSGSSFFGGIFNAHPDFFFVYEPLNQLKRIVNRNSEDYMDSAEYVVNAILNCNFEDDGFLEIMSRAGFHRASCRPLVSPPFCNTTHEKAINFATNQNWKLCSGIISADALNKICHKHANVASKILLESIEPVDLSWVLYISGVYSVPPSPPMIQPAVRTSKGPENKDKPVYVLYLVRDPRAMIYSRHRLGWVVPRERNEFAMESGEADDNIMKVCDMIELNLGAVLRHPRHIKLVRYEELATNPEEVIRDLFRELHISPSKEVFRWIYHKTHGPVNLSALSLSRNASVSINAWRKKIPHKLLEIIETRCARVMKYLGYLPSNGSQEMLRDLRTPLYLNKIRDLKERYQLPI